MTPRGPEDGRKPFSVVLMGLDGTGKSTQAERLELTMAAARQRVVRIHHASAKVPGIRTLKRRYHASVISWLKRRHAHVEYDDGVRESRGGGTATARALAAYLVVGSFIKSIWYARRYPRHFLVFDRCVLDDIVKARWRLGVTSRWPLTLLRALPRPDAVVVFEADPATTYARKKATNCTYAEYLAKGRVLDDVLAEARRVGWPVTRVAIEGRNVEEVHEVVARIVHEARA